MSDIDDYFDGVDNLPMPERNAEALKPQATGSSIANTRLGSALHGTYAAAVTTADAATFGVARPIVGAALAAPAVLRTLGGGGTAGEIGEEFSRGFQQSNEAFDELREGLPLGVRMGAEIAGGMRGAPRMIDEALEGMIKFAPTRNQNIKRTAAELGAIYPQAVIDGYMRGDLDFDDAMKSGVIDTMLGFGAQRAIGDKILPGIDRAVNRMRGVSPEAYPASVLGTTGRAQDGMSISQLYEITQRGIPENATLFDLNVDNMGRATSVERLYNGLAKLTFPGQVDPRLVNSDPALQAQVALYDQTKQALDTAFQNANARYWDTLGTRLGDYQTQYQTIKSSAPSAKEAGQVLESIRSTKPRPDGTLPIGATVLPGEELIGLMDDTGKALADSFGLVDIKQIPQPAQQVWRKFNDQFRVKTQEEFGLDVKIDPITRATKDISEAFNDITLAELYNGRAALSEFMGPSAPSLEHQKAAVSLMKALDEQIDVMTNKGAGLARGAFSQAKRIDEAYEMGTKFYRNQYQDAANIDPRTRVDYDASLADYIASLDPKSQESFRQGWKRGMFEAAEKNGPSHEFNRLLGDANASAARYKVGGERAMRTVLGDEATNDIIKLHNEGEHLIGLTDDLNQLYLLKNADPAARADLKSAAIRAYKDESNLGGDIAAGLAKLKKFVQRSDEGRVLEMERLMRLSGNDLADALEKSIKAYIPLPRSVSSRSTALMSDTSDWLSEAAGRVSGSGDGQEMTPGLLETLQEDQTVDPLADF